jgi:hypothetical protein
MGIVGSAGNAESNRRRRTQNFDVTEIKLTKNEEKSASLKKISPFMPSFAFKYE